MLSGTSVYCDVQEVRTLTGLTTTDVSDDILSSVIMYSTAKINADIQIKRSDESVGYIDDEKENTKNGSNTTFYTKYYPVGDRDNNGVISGIDVYAYKLDSSGTRTDIIVSTIDNVDIGKVTLSSAPGSSDSLYFTYYSSPVNMKTPHRLVNQACTELAGALAFTRIDARKVQSYRVGKITVSRQSDAFNIFHNMYNATIRMLKSSPLKRLRGEKVI